MKKAESINDPEVQEEIEKQASLYSEQPPAEKQSDERAIINNRTFKHF